MAILAYKLSAGASNFFVQMNYYYFGGDVKQVVF